MNTLYLFLTKAFMFMPYSSPLKRGSSLKMWKVIKMICDLLALSHKNSTFLNSTFFKKNKKHFNDLWCVTRQTGRTLLTLFIVASSAPWTLNQFMRSGSSVPVPVEWRWQTDNPGISRTSIFLRKDHVLTKQPLVFFCLFKC